MLTSMKRLKLWFAAISVALSFSFYTSTSFGGEKSEVQTISAYCDTLDNAKVAAEKTGDLSKYVKFMLNTDGCMDYRVLNNLGRIPFRFIQFVDKPVDESEEVINFVGYKMQIMSLVYGKSKIYSWRLALPIKRLDNI